MVRLGLWATRILGERRSRDFEMAREPSNQRLDGLFQLRQGNAGMTKQSELDGEANPIGIPAAFRHQLLIGARQGEASRHAVSVKRDAKKNVPFLVSQQLPVRHPRPPMKGADPTGQLSGKRPLNGQAWNVRKPWTSDGNPDSVVGGRENGQNAVANVGYARVSTIEQSPALQFDALAAAGCVKVFEDRASGARADRAGLLSALDYVRDGDVLIVWKLDRLGRSLPHLIETVTSLAIRGVGFRSITEAIDTTTPGGRLVFHLFGALGQFERDLIQERTRAGLAAAAARGRKGGRKAVVTSEKLERARAIIAKGLTVREAATRLKVGKTALYAALRG